MKKNNTIDAFFALIKAGLWERDIQLASFKYIQYNQVLKLAEEQSVVGLVAAGLEHVVDTKIPKEEVLPLVGQTLQLEQRNTAMNNFIGTLIQKMRDADIYSILIKGQGIAQCYERPLWRACGDVDLLLSDSNYKKAKDFLLPLATVVESEEKYGLHVGMTIDSWEVELHGNLRSGLWHGIDKTLDKIQESVFYEGKVRTWGNGKTQVFILDVNEHLVYVFSHILQHFYKKGIGLRQVCDWCRILWTYRDTIDKELLNERLHQMGIVSEWKAFAAFAVLHLGMKQTDIPFYNSSSKWISKADYIYDYLLRMGNFGHNINNEQKNYSLIKRKWFTLTNIIRNSLSHVIVFPYSSIRTCCYQLGLGLKSTLGLL